MKMRSALPIVLSLLAGCGPGLHPFLFPTTTSVPNGVPADSLRLLIRADRTAFLQSLDSTRLNFYAREALHRRDRHLYYTLAGLVASAIGLAAPNFMHTDNDKRRVSQAASGVGLVISGMIAFHRDGERASEMERCAREINTARVTFSSVVANTDDIADSLAKQDPAPWNRYIQDKIRTVAQLQGTCSVTGRAASGAP